MGAASKADILTGGRRNMLLLDRQSPPGIETLGSRCRQGQPSQLTVPFATPRYTTFVDNQTAININIHQACRELTKDCRLLAKFKLGGIPPLSSQQMAQVDVTFLVDANGQLTVSAKEPRSGQQTAAQCSQHTGSAEVPEKLVVDSVEHAHEDFNRRRFIELKNKADTDPRHTAGRAHASRRQADRGATSKD